MRKRLLLSCILSFTGVVQAQPYDLLLAGGHVIDPANGIDEIRDVAISGNRIAAVEKKIPPSQSRKTVSAKGLYLTPGFVDLHVHVYGYSGSLFPDDTSLITGSTTVVDAGGAGWRTFEDFKAKIIDKSKTRVLSFINIVGRGMLGPEIENNVEDIDPVKTAEKIRQYPQLIVGIKTAHFARPGWTAIDRAVQAGRSAGVPVMVDSGILTGQDRHTRVKLLDHMRPGDIHTHTYNDRQLELVDRFTGKVQEYARQARERGVLFDIGHGDSSFLWPVATRAMAQGFPPDSISTDLHQTGIMIPEGDMPSTISKLMSLGMPLQDAIARSTVNPARAIRRFPELGTLGIGRTADIAVFAMRTGVFALRDSWGKKRLARQRLECVLTVRDGKIVFDNEGLGWPVWSEAGDYETLK